MGYYWCSSDWELTIPTGNSYEKLTATLGHSCEIAGPQKRIQSKQQRLHIQNHGTSKLLWHWANRIKIVLYALKWIVNWLVALDF